MWGDYFPKFDTMDVIFFIFLRWNMKDLVLYFNDFAGFKDFIQLCFKNISLSWCLTKWKHPHINVAVSRKPVNIYVIAFSVSKVRHFESKYNPESKRHHPWWLKQIKFRYIIWCWKNKSAWNLREIINSGHMKMGIIHKIWALFISHTYHGLSILTRFFLY